MMKNTLKTSILLTLLSIFTFHGNAQLPSSGNAYDFSNDYISAPNSASLNPSVITLEAWIKADSWATNIWENVIISKDGWASGEQGYTLRSGASGSLSFNVGSPGAWHEVTTGALMSVGQWYHVAGTYDGTTMRIYINGEEINTSTFVGAIASSTYELNIGKIAYTAGGSRYFDGMIDEVRIWSTPLPQSSIQDYMCKKVTSGHPEYASLAGHWNFDDVGTILDSSPNANNATNTGATQTVSGAPIGDESIHSYTGPFDLTLPWMSTDSLQVESTSVVQTIHLYRVDMPPTDLTTDATIDSMDYSHYYGVYVGANSAYSYDLSYHYGSNAIAVGNESNLDLAGRTDGTIAPWTSQNATLNLPFLKLDKTGTNRTEVMLGLSCSTINLDTSGPQEFCAGDTLIVTDLTTNSNYQWYDGLVPIVVETTNSLVITQSGDYSLIANTGFCADTSATLNVVVNALPIVSFGTGPAPAVCEYAADFPLTGSTPAGGIYSGTGVIGGNFSPSTAGPGAYWITYTYVDGSLCAASDSMEFTVHPQPATPVITASGETMCVASGGVGVVYIWELNGTQVASSTDTCYTALANGNYTVVCVSAEGCISDEALHTIDFIGIGEIDWNSEFSIVPNPTEGIVMVTLPIEWSKALMITVLDAEGRQLQAKSITGGVTQLDITAFDSGIYYFILESDGEKFVKRAVKY